MATNIVQIEDKERNRQLLRVSGEMFLEDALILEKIALEMRENLGESLTLDLADLDFLDSESAPILKRLEREHKFRLEGLEIFLQKTIKNAD